MTANVIKSEEVNFLCGTETTKGWKIKVDVEDDKLEFKEQDKMVKIEESEGSHQLVKLEMVGIEEESVNFLKEEDDAVVCKSVLRKIHKILNHKSKEHLNFSYCNAGKLTPQARKWIDRVVKTCMICKKNKKSNSKPSVAIPSNNICILIFFYLKYLTDNPLRIHHGILCLLRFHLLKFL